MQNSEFEVEQVCSSSMPLLRCRGVGSKNIPPRGSGYRVQFRQHACENSRGKALFKRVMRFFCELSISDLLEHPYYEDLCRHIATQIGIGPTYSISIDLEMVKCDAKCDAPMFRNLHDAVEHFHGTTFVPDHTSTSQFPTLVSQDSFASAILHRLPVSLLFAVDVHPRIGTMVALPASISSDSIATDASVSTNLSAPTTVTPVATVTFKEDTLERGDALDHKRIEAPQPSLFPSPSLPNLIAGRPQERSLGPFMKTGESVSTELAQAGTRNGGRQDSFNSPSGFSRSVSSNRLKDDVSRIPRRIIVCILGDQMLRKELGALDRCRRLVQLAKEEMADRFVIEEKLLLLRSAELTAFSWNRYPLIREADLIVLCSRSESIVSPGNDIGRALVEIFHHRHLQERVIIVCPALHSSPDDTCGYDKLRPSTAIGRFCQGTDTVHSLFRKLDGWNRLLGINIDAKEDWNQAQVSALNKCIVRNVLTSSAQNTIGPSLRHPRDHTMPLTSNARPARAGESTT